MEVVVGVAVPAGVGVGAVVLPGGLEDVHEAIEEPVGVVVDVQQRRVGGGQRPQAGGVERLAPVAGHYCVGVLIAHRPRSGLEA